MGVRVKISATEEKGSKGPRPFPYSCRVLCQDLVALSFSRLRQFPTLLTVRLLAHPVMHSHY